MTEPLDLDLCEITYNFHKAMDVHDTWHANSFLYRNVSLRGKDYSYNYFLNDKSLTTFNLMKILSSPDDFDKSTLEYDCIICFSNKEISKLTKPYLKKVYKIYTAMLTKYRNNFINGYYMKDFYLK